MKRDSPVMQTAGAAHTLTVGKAELVAALCDRVGLSRQEATEMVEAFFEIVRDTLAVGDAVKLAAAAGLDWAAIEPLEEDELERRVLSPASSPDPSKRIEPDCNVIHRELRRKGVTLQLLWEEYVESNPPATIRFAGSTFM